MQRKVFIMVLALIFAFSVFIPATARAYDKPKNTDPSKYYILLDLKNQFMTVFEKDDSGKYTKIVRRMAVTTGKTKGDPEKALLDPTNVDYIPTPTPRGIYKTGGHERFGKFPEFGGTWARYWTHLVGGVFIHSIMFSKNDVNTLQSGAYGGIGRAKSHGCVRMYVEDAKWVYNWIPAGTTINVSDTEKSNSKIRKALKSKMSFSAYKALQKKFYNPPELPNFKATVVKDSSPLRTGNGQPTDHILAKMKKGSKVEVLLISDPWCKVKYNNRTGYTLTANLKVDGEIPVSGNTTDFTSGNNAYVLSETVRMYEKPDEKSTYICKIAKFTSVKILSKQDKWTQVQFYDYTGYIQSKYVKKGWGIEYK